METLKRRNDMENKANVENNLSFPNSCKGQVLKTMQEIINIEHLDENLIKELVTATQQNQNNFRSHNLAELKSFRITIFRPKAINKF